MTVTTGRNWNRVSTECNCQNFHVIAYTLATGLVFWHSRFESFIPILQLISTVCCFFFLSLPICAFFLSVLFLSHSHCAHKNTIGTEHSPKIFGQMKAELKVCVSNVMIGWCANVFVSRHDSALDIEFGRLNAERINRNEMQPHDRHSTWYRPCSEVIRD